MVGNQEILEAFKAARTKSDKVYEDLMASLGGSDVSAEAVVRCSPGEHCGGGTVSPK
jgi:hypothetical protein